ncbi:c-type cytochrome [Aquisalimonas sp.]|uniref:c-type cytochrome n=1 Tax=unclassified Aquisalimonas TaxID=2644645 RepID=UPI0025BDEDFB|nr:c-type cytochrome [Aquisalimonas sp.]
MNNWIKVVIAGSALIATPFLQAGDVSRGEDLSGECMACHAAEGNTDNPDWPIIHGQGKRYLYEQLQAYKSGDRENAVMQSQVADLDDQDLRDLAAYFASQEGGISGGVDPDLKDLGESIYRGGLPDEGVAACMACHGPAGEGMPGAGYPRLSGQLAEYTADQLRKYRDGERSTDRNRMMRDIAERMSDEEIEAVSSYISGLHKRESE